jgi:DNA polymerase IV
MTSPPGAVAGGRWILHVDMDAFFVSVELLRRPELRGRPVLVGGAGSRGVVAAASYEARSYGVHSAMPSAIARRRCPDAVFLPGDHPHYSRVSSRLMALFAEVTPLVEPLSLDEAFLDVTGAGRRLGAPDHIARTLRSRVREAEGLSCSIGVATNKFLAKLATNSAKPRASRTGPVEGTGVHLVPPGGELAYLHPLPVGALWGVGPTTLEKLTRLGVVSVGDLAATPPERLAAALGRGAAQHLLALSRGQDDRPVEPERAPKSISHEETFATDRHALDELRPEVVRQAHAVASRLRAASLRGRTVQLKVRYGDFTTVTRSTTLSSSTDRGTEVVEVAWAMLEQLPVGRGVRLLGVGVSGLVDEPAQLELGFDEHGGAGQWDAANHALDEIRDRFGSSSIGPARLAGRRGPGPSAPWGPDPTGPAGPGEIHGSDESHHV